MVSEPDPIGGADPRQALEEDWRRAFDWIEAELSARIVAFERQPRWRPAFFLDLDRDGERFSVYLRGERGELDHGVYPLEHEYRVLRVLEGEGLRVPHVHGFCPDPPAIVMEKSAGRANLATASSEKERIAVLDDYMDLLADMHAIDPGRFEAIGIDRPMGAEALGFMDLDRWEGIHRASKKRPEPIIEFTIGWLRRNVPRGRENVSCLAVDAGQFLFDEGRVTAMIDFELACLGDPAADLAAMRGRDMGEPLGDLDRAFARYHERTGSRIPTPVIDYHTVRFNLYTPLTCASIVADPPISVDLVQYLGWYWVWSRASIEVIAARLGVELTPPAIPEPVPAFHLGAHRLLTEKLAEMRDAQEGFRAFELDTAWRNAHYLERVASMWPRMAAEEAAEIDALLGRVTRPLDREADLEAFVLEEGASREEELLQLFYRRCLRHEALMGSSLRELEGARIQPIS
ncbi:MAG TPA: phosphotransferase family protein [Deltaproteobacteria bacterium]|nr:phosphotransferase family protein [Deltaproteobacteria bacterium]